MTAGCKPLRLPLQAPANDPEGARVPPGLPPIVDAHVHLFPDWIFDALWRWFETHAWPVRYPLRTPAVIEFLLSRGLDHLVALHYAHKPGIARGMNRYLAEVCRREPRVTGVATVFPGEPDAAAILEEAFALGLRGVKLHCHVQCFSPDDERCAAIYEACARHDAPLVMHAGREPRSSAYPVDTYEICSVDRTERVLRAWPKLRLCVPHLGADEFEGYAKLLERHENLWLDTTMMLAEFFPGFDAAPLTPADVVRARPDRILYGTDFPNLPYAWDREVVRLARLGLREEDLARVLGTNARELFGIEAKGLRPERP